MFVLVNKIESSVLFSCASVDCSDSISFKFVIKLSSAFLFLKGCKFLKESKKNNATIINGMQMLEIQAEESWKIWNT